MKYYILLFAVLVSLASCKVTSETSCPTYQDRFSDVIDYKQHPNASKNSLKKKFKEHGYTRHGKGGRVNNDRGKSMKAQRKFYSKLQRKQKTYSKKNKKSSQFRGRLARVESPKPYHWNGQKE